MTQVVGLITNNGKTAYREKVGTLTAWCQERKLYLNASKTKEPIVEFRKNKAGHAPVLINRVVVVSLSLWITSNSSVYTSQRS